PGHEVAVYTHGDTDHIHNHIVINSVNFETGKKYQAHGKEAIERARSLSDEVCKSHDLSVVKEHNASVRHTLAEQHLLEKNKISWKDELREAIEYARDNSTNFDSFKRHLNDVYGVETKLRGKTLSFKHPERERFIRANKLGDDYEREGLEHVFARQIEREQEPERENLIRNNKVHAEYEREWLENVYARQKEREQEHEIAISRNEGTQQTDKKLYHSSHERGNGERRHDTQSIESDSRKIGQSHEQHAINYEHPRQDGRRKRREFASDFDKWTRGNGKEQQQDGKSRSRDAKIEREGIESNKQRNKHEQDEHKEKSQLNSQKSRARYEGLSL